MASCEHEKKILPGEIKALPSTEEILKLLECPCCLEPPVPPIKTCATGHIICSFCRPRLTRCAICREPYTECRNYPLETIFNGCTIVCKFWGKGCQQIVPGCKFIDHVKICRYRTLCCSHCQESVSPVDNYVDHLREQHQAVGYDQEVEVYECKNTFALDLHNDIRFPDQYALFDGKYFIVSAHIRSHFLYIWLSIVQNYSASTNHTNLDEESTLAEMRKRANESHYSAIITMLPEEKQVPQAKWTIPIFPLQNGDPDPSIIVNIPVHPTFQCFLTHYSTDESNETNTAAESVRKYSWCFRYCISKNHD